MILDSGDRTIYETGATRDIQLGKGRCDLIPLTVIGDRLDTPVLEYIEKYIFNGDYKLLWDAIDFAVEEEGEDIITAILDVSIHYEHGALKYGERNWEKGIPLHSYIDSGVRHYLKYLRGDTDEEHRRAFIWNMLCAIHTQIYIPDMVDLPFKENFKE